MKFSSRYDSPRSFSNSMRYVRLGVIEGLLEQIAAETDDPDRVRLIQIRAEISTMIASHVRRSREGEE